MEWRWITYATVAQMDRVPYGVGRRFESVQLKYVRSRHSDSIADVHRKLGLVCLLFLVH